MKTRCLTSLRAAMLLLVIDATATGTGRTANEDDHKHPARHRDPRIRSTLGWVATSSRSSPAWPVWTQPPSSAFMQPV
ncbi:hypothetical protein B188_14080 [Candidatus Brocadiaceae bacterium B188]|nr:hypothetical protein [Candidatus Brocadia sapporoensis]QQR66476.1 MAG: hypothetical protein IPI25_13340 [Candidatus Brocadia sp.]RZV57073.1 MAG: hypothetical protein EX330_11405 [Candidatus Brocadia sp. BROELEC01]TWU53440.1 hypothetical protein B188_14080 [Candidatus Brocadiaceae bacterium B188]